MKAGLLIPVACAVIALIRRDYVLMLLWLLSAAVQVVGNDVRALRNDVRELRRQLEDTQ